MHLWTEYEGRTIAGAYTLGKLLRSEGRNGFFATSTSTGHSAVIRLTEAHFDEEEVLQRWRHVAELHQQHLIDIEQVGKTTFDGVPLTYALMERNDANLEDVLKERPLTAAETMEVGKSVLAALKALHASGLVHEHLEPINVLAVGEVVKLRSDCVRECVADGEFTSPEACDEVRRRDLHDFGVLLLRCLTLERELTPSQRLPDPFKRLIPGAMEGTMTLPEMEALLNPPVFTPAAPYASPAAPYASSAASPVPPQANASSPRATERPVVAAPATQIPVRTRATPDYEEPEAPSRRNLWIAIAAAVVVLLLGWHFLHGHAAAPAATVPAAAVASRPAAPVAAPVAQAPRAAAPVESRPEAPHLATAREEAGWHVIAYTYNHEGQARAKAVRLSTRHLSFHPQVFSPSGHAPYLVSLGGAMSEDEARAVQRRARREGLPRDTFIRRY